MAIKVYNVKTEDYSSHPNNFYIYRGTVLGNPFTYDGKRSSLARLSFRTKEEALSAYEEYFKRMYEMDIEFKMAVDEIYEKYKNGEDIYLGCFCKPLSCHGDIIAKELQKRLIKEKRNKK
jgi:hypothetical protein